MPTVIGNQELVRKTNQRLLINIIRKQGPISRADLAKTLNLSAPSVSANIDKLLKRNILLEIGAGDSRGGRPPILLQFNPAYGYVAAVDLSSDRVRVALADLNGMMIANNSLAVREAEGKEVLTSAIEGVYSLIEQSGLKREGLLAVALATPGILDKTTGKLHLVPQYPGWEGFPIVRVANDGFKCPVLIKNDINTATLGETLYGAGIGKKSLAYISVDTGIGAGIVLNGQLFEGTHGAAGEIGHLIHNPSSIPRRRSGLGNLEAAVSVTALINAAKSQLSFAADDQESQLAELLREIKNGNEDLKALLQEQARIMGMVIANLNLTLDLQLIIVGGAITVFGDYFIETVRRTVNDIVPLTLPIVYSSLDNLSVIRGGFFVASEQVVNDLVNEG